MTISLYATKIMGNRTSIKRTSEQIQITIQKQDEKSAKQTYKQIMDKIEELQQNDQDKD